MDASRILGLVYKAQLERVYQVEKGYDAAHDASHTPAEWAALAQRHLDQLREWAEQDAQMQQQYGPEEGWPEEVMEEYDWPATEKALIKLVAVLFAWNDARDWTNAEYVSVF